MRNANHPALKSAITCLFYKQFASRAIGITDNHQSADGSFDTLSLEIEVLNRFRCIIRGYVVMTLNEAK